MPTRILLRLFLLAGLVAPFCAFALGIGSLQVRSALNQNFEADIPLIANNPAELVGLTVQIPPQPVFDQLGVERLKLMADLRFAVQTPPGGPNLIKVTSVQPIREPNFDLLVEATWPRGRLLRTFPVQLDPELYANRREPPPAPQPVEVPLVEAPPVAAAPPAPGLPPAPPVSFEGASFYGPVRSGENLTRIANQVRPSDTISLPDMMAILVAGNPEAFINGNPNLLRVGAVLKVPAPQALGVQGAPVVASTPAVEIAAATIPVDSTLSPPELVSQPSEPLTPPVSQPPEAATAPETLIPPVSQPPEAATAPETLIPPVAQPSEFTPSTDSSAAPPAPVTPPLDQASPKIDESAPLAPLAPIAPQEIIPQTVIPQAETPPAPETAPSEASPPEAVAPAVAEPPPAPAPAPKAPAPPPQETSLDWLSNPVVWIAIALIVLAVASVLLIPLLRRPARPKKPTAESKEEPVSVAVDEGEEAATTSNTQIQIRKPRPQRQPPSTEAMADTAPLSSGEPTASKPAAVSPPKPIDELLKDIDFGLGDEKSRTMTGINRRAAPAGDLESRRLPDAEPPTSPGTRIPPGSVAPVKLVKPAPDLEKPPAPAPNVNQPPSEFSSGLPLDKLDFDLGDLGLGASRNQAPELPPLELKSAEPSKTATRSPLDFDLPDLEPPTQSGFAQEPSKPKAADLKFEFTDVGQENEKAAHGELAKLDEELLSFGDVDLGKMELDQPNIGADTGADYVETKLDLASAYLDMGDQMGARGLLEDVLREGDASQKKRAEEMLKKAG
ncbi:MAG: hypothetical protein H6975_03810 [Gammaproteobacteria bacterium]|nr:hypothetical protein [Gammaproteobacteria bacterium]